MNACGVTQRVWRLGWITYRCSLRAGHAGQHQAFIGMFPSPLDRKWS